MDFNKQAHRREGVSQNMETELRNFIAEFVHKDPEAAGEAIIKIFGSEGLGHYLTSLTSSPEIEELVSNVGGESPSF